MTTASCHPDSIAPASALEDLKIAAVWGVLAGLSAMALIPYVAQLMPEVFAKIPVPLWVLALAQGAQAAVILGMLAWLGLRMGHRVGLGSRPALRSASRSTYSICALRLRSSSSAHRCAAARTSALMRSG